MNWCGYLSEQIIIYGAASYFNVAPNCFCFFKAICLMFFVGNIFSFCLSFFLSFFFFFFFLVFLEPHLWLRGQIGAMVAGYTIATAMWDPSGVCDLHHSSQQHQILNPLIEAKDQTCSLMDTSWVFYHWATMGTPQNLFFL